MALSTWCVAQGAKRTGEIVSPAVHTEMSNVFYHYTDRIVVHIYWLEGAIRPTVQGTIPVFDDPKSFFLAIDSAKIAIPTRALSETLNERVFASQDAPLKNIEVSAQGERLRVKGKMHTRNNLLFEIVSTLSPTEDGKIRIHSEKVSAEHLPVKGLMDLLGVDISRLIDTRRVRGLTAEGNDLILDPEQILPLPRIGGKVSSVEIRGDQVIQVFGQAKVPIHDGKRNYMSYRGGELRFGKLTMNDSDMDLIDLNPDDPFDFYLDHYREQLSAGYTKITPQFGLRVYMRDYNKLAPHQRH
jgi:hypothetical protein